MEVIKKIRINVEWFFYLNVIDSFKQDVEQE